MTDSKLPEGQDDPSAAPEYRQLGEEGNPFSDAGIDKVPAEEGDSADNEAENPPLPDWGPTDGTHGVDGADPDA